MPNYDYKCNGCSHTFERFEGMTQDKPKTCPKCKKRKARRLIGKGNFILKGDGFYNTTYRNKDNPPASEKK